MIVIEGVCVCVPGIYQQEWLKRKTLLKHEFINSFGLYWDLTNGSAKIVGYIKCKLELSTHMVRQACWIHPRRD